MSHRSCFGNEVFKSWKVEGAVIVIMAVAAAAGFSDFGDSTLTRVVVVWEKTKSDEVRREEIGTVNCASAELDRMRTR